MKRTLALLALVVSALIVGVLGGTPAQAASSVDLPWTNDMNKASYWNSYFANDSRTVSCTKYENHSGWIPAEYDAAVTKKGSEVVRVYADLTNVGGFNATHPQGEPPMSWVMKCRFTPVQTTTTTTTTTTEPPVTTVPETTVPETTQPPTTAPETTTPETTAPPVTTAPTPETTVVAVTTPPTPPTTPPAPQSLPETGAEHWMMALAAALAIAGGGGLVRLARRS